MPNRPGRYSGGNVSDRLEYLRGEIRAERISQGEIAELESLVAHIDPGDVELLQWAGVPELDGLDDFTKAYIAAALWAETDQADDSGGEPLDANYTPQDIAPAALVKIAADCQKFQQDNADALAEAYKLYTVTDGSSPEAYAGHDFWLTRNGHGAGFWDRDLGDIGDKLTEACKAFGDCYIYVGDDGKIYV